MNFHTSDLLVCLLFSDSVALLFHTIPSELCITLSFSPSPSHSRSRWKVSYGSSKMSAEFVRSRIKAPLLCCLLTSGLAERKPDTSRKQLPLRIWTLITVWSALWFHLCGRGSVTVLDGRIKSPVFVNSPLSFAKNEMQKGYSKVQTIKLRTAVNIMQIMHRFQNWNWMIFGWVVWIGEIYLDGISIKVKGKQVKSAAFVNAHFLGFIKEEKQERKTVKKERKQDIQRPS